jgi:hypothetical protein
MNAVKITQLPLGPLMVNTYIVACRETGQSAIVDPAGDPQRIIVYPRSVIRFPSLQQSEMKRLP